MSKKSVSGIKNDRRSIRNIADDDGQEPPRQNNRNQSSQPETEPPRQSRNQTAATVGMWLIGGVIILLLFFLFSVIFAQTTVTVTPRTAPISFDDTVQAQPAGTATDTPNTLSYSITTAETTASQVAESTAVTYREAKAKGKITIYNEFSSDSLQLVDNTRFQSPDGNIYRTQEPVSVPGKDGNTPGTVTVEVVADQPGSEFNIENDVRFSVPGLAGTPQEGAVYAQLATPITGGIAREVPTVSTSTRERIVNSLTDGLKDTLRKRVRGKTDENHVIYDDGIFFQTDTSSRQTAEEQATINVTGTARAVTFDTRELAIFFARNSGIDVSADTNLRLADPHDFTVSFADASGLNPNDPQPIQLDISGNSTVIWQYNKQALARDLQGLQKSQVTEVFDNYTSIQEAQINTRPFWKRSLPSDAENITITTELNTPTR